MKLKKVLPLPTFFVQFSVITLLFLFLISNCKKDEGCMETTWYQDNDNDGRGNPSVSVSDCDQPLGYVNNNIDNDDTQAYLYDKRIPHGLTSTVLSEEYPLNIFLPGIFETNNNLPVIYLLDGQYYFEDVIDYTKGIGFDAIIVGIGNHLANGIANGNTNEYFEMRKRDFLPGFSYNGVVGGHLKFYEFITEEVIPYIDQNYDNDQDSRSLVGHHAAGLFTNFSLLNEAPENSFFHGYLSINAEILNSDILIDMADSLVSSPDAENIKLHISQVSSSEKAEWFNQLLSVDNNFLWLDIDLFTFEDENTDAFNPAVVEPSIKKGLKFIYGL